MASVAFEGDPLRVTSTSRLRETVELPAPLIVSAPLYVSRPPMTRVSPDSRLTTTVSPSVVNVALQVPQPPIETTFVVPSYVRV